METNEKVWAKPEANGWASYIHPCGVCGYKPSFVHYMCMPPYKETLERMAILDATAGSNGYASLKGVGLRFKSGDCGCVRYDLDERWATLRGESLIGVPANGRRED